MILWVCKCQRSDFIRMCAAGDGERRVRLGQERVVGILKWTRFDVG